MSRRRSRRRVSALASALTFGASALLPPAVSYAQPAPPVTQPSTASVDELDRPTTEPADGPDHPDRPGDDDRRGRGDRDGRGPGSGGWFQYSRGGLGIPGGGGPGGWQSLPDPSPEQWEAIATFMQQNSPFRWSVYQHLAEERKDQPIVVNARKRIAARFLQLEAQRNRDEELYNFVLKQFQIEDRVLDGLDKISQGNAPADTDEKVNAAIREWFQNHLAEREARLKRLREYVDREAAALANDKAKMDELIPRQRDVFQREANRMSGNPGAGPGPDGPPDRPQGPQPATQPRH